MKIHSGLMIVLISTLPFSNINSAPLTSPLPTIAENCQQWKDVRHEKAEQTTMYWLQGFVAAYNEYEYRGRHPEGVFKTSDSTVIATWLDEYCQNNPQSNPQKAVESLIEEKKPPQKACPVKKSSGRPCIPLKEEDVQLEEQPKKKNKWLPWWKGNKLNL